MRQTGEKGELFFQTEVATEALSIKCDTWLLKTAVALCRFNLDKLKKVDSIYVYVIVWMREKTVSYSVLLMWWIHYLMCWPKKWVGSHSWQIRFRSSSKCIHWTPFWICNYHYELNDRTESCLHCMNTHGRCNSLDVPICYQRINLITCTHLSVLST